MVTSTAYAPLTPGTLAFEIQQAVAHNDTSAMITFSLAAGSTIRLTAGDVSSNTSFGATAYVVSASARITIDGSAVPGLSIDGGGAVRLFAVTSSASLTLEDLTVTGGLAKGGAGGNAGSGGGGGGGAGLGGAVYNDGGTFTADGVTFTNNTAQGGNGGGGDPAGHRREGGRRRGAIRARPGRQPWRCGG